MSWLTLKRGEILTDKQGDKDEETQTQPDQGIQGFVFCHKQIGSTM